MPSTPKSPYITPFRSAINRGTPCWQALCNIANTWNTSPSVVGNSLCKAGLCERQKFNGQWIFFPTFGSKSSATVTKKCQTQLWQNFCDWCICNGICTPEQMFNKCGSQASFMKACRPMWNKQFKTTTSRATSTTKGRKTSSRSSSSSSYKFSKFAKSGRSSNKLRKVA